MAEEVMLDVANGQPALVERATDPVIPGGIGQTPSDFAAQYPTPLDTTELIAMCEEVGMLQAIPEIGTGLKQHTWRELNALSVTGSNNTNIFFADGVCPEDYGHDGTNYTVTLKNLGTKKSLTISDIMHSAAVASANWNGINTLVGGGAGSSGIPGGENMGSFIREHVASVKEKEMRLASVLTLNALDRFLVLGSTATSALQFDGFEQWQTNMGVTFHTNATAASGSFSGVAFDRWLSEACAKPTHVFGHPQAIQEMMSAYFQLGYQGSQIVNFSDGNRITPGFNFGAFVNTGVGRLQVVSDIHFTKTASGATTFMSRLYAMRMTHNGEPLVYQNVQIPLGINDLAPGCTAVSFQTWTKRALIIKNACMHGEYTGFFTGRASITTCTNIG